MESPDCMASNPNRLMIFIPTIITCIVVKNPMESTGYKIFNKIIPVAKFPLGSEAREAKAQMLGERIFRLVVNVTCVALLYKVLL